MSSTGTPPPLPNTSFPPTATSSSTATSTSTSGAGTTTTTANTGTPASATLLFGFLVIFVALFAAFVLLAVLWQCQRRRREAAAPQIMLEFDESKGTYKGVPEMREVWIQEEPSGGRHWEWENIRPLSVDVDDTSPYAIAPASQSQSQRLRPRRTWPYNIFRHRPVPPQPSQQPPLAPGSVPPPSPPPEEAQQRQREQADDANVTIGVSAPVLIGGVRMSFVIAMPHADAPANRRRSGISQVSCFGEGWRHREFALGIYHPPFRNHCAL